MSRLTQDDKLKMVGLKIAYYRRLNGYTQTEFADAVSVSRNTICRIENAETAPSLSLIFHICEVLEITEKQLFDFDD